MRNYIKHIINCTSKEFEQKKQNILDLLQEQNKDPIEINVSCKAYSAVIIKDNNDDTYLVTTENN